MRASTLSLAALLLALLAAPAALAHDGFRAVDSGVILGGAIGGGAGAAVGSAIGGRDGAIIGGALGAATGVAISGQPRPIVIHEHSHHQRHFIDHDPGRHRGHGKHHRHDRGHRHHD